MKPDTEYHARTLAELILRDEDLDTRAGRMHEEGVGQVTVEMTGMVRKIRRELLLDHASLAKTIAEEIKRKTEAVDFDRLVREAVDEEVQCVVQTIEEAITQRVDLFVRERIEQELQTWWKMVHHDAFAAAMDKIFAEMLAQRRKR